MSKPHELTDVQLKALDLMIAAKQAGVAFDDVDLIDEVGEVAEAIAEVTEAIGASTALIDALKTAVVPGAGFSIEALLKIRKEAAHRH